MAVLSTESLRGAPLADRTKHVLSTRGVPDELTLPGWLGPTLFTPEIVGSTCAMLSEFLGGAPHTETGFVLGTIRETQSTSAGIPYAAFILQPPRDEVILVDLVGPRVRRFVNSSLECFLDSLDLFTSAWPQVLDGHNVDADRGVRRLRKAMTRLDPPAWELPDHYWPTWFEEFTD